jgi:hypothetical protein
MGWNDREPHFTALEKLRDEILEALGLDYYSATDEDRETAYEQALDVYLTDVLHQDVVFH